jgi:DsrE/DsrF-like family
MFVREVFNLPEAFQGRRPGGAATGAFLPLKASSKAFYHWRYIMAKILITGTHGVENPTKAGLTFLTAKAAKETGHDVTISLVGDGAIVMQSAVRDSIVPVAFPPLKELFQFVIDNKIPVFV